MRSNSSVGLLSPANVADDTALAYRGCTVSSKSMRFIGFILILVSLLLSVALSKSTSLAQGPATIIVTSSANSGGTCPDAANCTLRAAVASAASGDTIQFSGTVTGIITLSTPITID